MEIGIAIGIAGLVASVLSFFVGLHYGKKSADESKRAADAAERVALTDRQRFVSGVQAKRIDKRPEVFGHQARISGGGNVEIHVENLSDNVARNVEVVLWQEGQLIGSKTFAHLARGEDWNQDLHPPGVNGFQVGLEYKVVCEFDAPDEHRWQSVRVSRANNTGSTTDYILLRQP